MADSFCVYLHVNKINGKKYCGITSQKPENRWRNSGKGYSDNPHFSSAISKYGWDAFEHIILYDGITREEACMIEREYISAHQLTSPEFGYNATLGGDGTLGYKHTEETKNKMSRSRIGHMVTDETKEKISHANSGENNGMFGRTPWNLGIPCAESTKEKVSKSRTGKTAEENHPMFGKLHTEESKRKMSESHKGCKAWNKGLHTGIIPQNVKPVGQYDDSGALIKKFSSIAEAAREVGCCKQNITRCCRGKVGHAGGFVWKYTQAQRGEL